MCCLLWFVTWRMRLLALPHNSTSCYVDFLQLLWFWLFFYYLRVFKNLGCIWIYKINTLGWSTILRTSSDSETNSSPIAYLWKVCSVSYPVHHLLAVRMHSRHVAPHPLPGHALDGEAGPVNVEKDASVLLLFLPRRPGSVVGRRIAGLLLGAAAEEAMRAGAFGAAMPAQLGWGGAGPARGVGSRHWSQEGEEELALRASSCSSVLDSTCCSQRVNLKNNYSISVQQGYILKHVTQSQQCFYHYYSTKLKLSKLLLSLSVLHL